MSGLLVDAVAFFIQSYAGLSDPPVENPEVFPDNLTAYESVAKGSIITAIKLLTSHRYSIQVSSGEICLRSFIAGNLKAR